MFPCLTPRVKQLLDELMREVAGATNGSLDFPDFVRMMRQFHDIQAEETEHKEHQAVEESGFSTEEVTDFREMFNACFEAVSDGNPNMHEELSLSDVCSMLDKICPMDEKNTLELSIVFREATKKYWTSQTPHDTIDFPEFLWMMDKVLRNNVAGLRERIGWQDPHQREAPMELQWS